MRLLKIFRKRENIENTEDRKNRIESAIKAQLAELTGSQKIEVLKRIVPHVDPDKRIYRYHRSGKQQRQATIMEGINNG